MPRVRIAIKDQRLRVIAKGLMRRDTTRSRRSCRPGGVFACGVQVFPYRQFRHSPDCFSRCFRYPWRMQEVLHFDVHGRSLLRHIQARIQQCRQLKAEAVTLDEREGWQAEESGLVDAFFGLDRTAIRRNFQSSHLPRYEAGLQDGRTIMKVLEQHASLRQNEFLGRTDPESESRLGGSSASPDTSLNRRQVAWPR